MPLVPSSLVMSLPGHRWYHQGANVMHLVGADVVATHLDHPAHCGAFLQSFEKTNTCTMQNHEFIDFLPDLMPAFRFCSIIFAFLLGQAMFHMHFAGWNVHFGGCHSTCIECAAPCSPV